MMARAMNTPTACEMNRMPICSGVSLFLISYVVPRFAEVYQGAGRNLPWMSQLLLSWGQFASGHTGLLLAIIAVVLGPPAAGVV